MLDDSDPLGGPVGIFQNILFLGQVVDDGGLPAPLRPDH